MSGGKIVVCNGGYRTGSTLSFNVCLRLAELTGFAGPGFRSVGAGHKSATELCADPRGPVRSLFIKSHEYAPGKVNPRVKIVRTCRDLLTVAASIRLFMPDKSDQWIIDAVRAQRDGNRYHAGRPDTLVIPYGNRRYGSSPGSSGRK